MAPVSHGTSACASSAIAPPTTNKIGAMVPVCFSMTDRNCKKIPCSLANGPQRMQKEGTVGRKTLLCIGCTSVVQCEQMVVLQSAKMQNFSAAEFGKAIRDNLRNVPHLIFRKLSLDNFPRSAKYPCRRFSSFHSLFRSSLTADWKNM